jgi:hypothetical protein
MEVAESAKEKKKHDPRGVFAPESCGEIVRKFKRVTVNMQV